MLRPVRVLPVLVLVLAVAACGQDLTKKTFERTTVPAGGNFGQTVAPTATDPKLSSDNMRLADPCQVLTAQMLAKYGTEQFPPEPDNYDHCTRSLRTPQGKAVNVALDLGGALSAALTPFHSTIRSQPTSELASGPQCSEDVLTDSAAGQGITLLYHEDGQTNVCGKARDLTGDVLDALRANPPQHQFGRGSLVAVKPCDQVDGGTVTAALGVPAQPNQINYRTCSWGQGSNPRLTVTFSLTRDNPAAAGPAARVDLGNGIAAFRGRSTTVTAPTCLLAWVHKANSGGRNEVVGVQVDDTANQGINTCGNATGVAKVLATRLPKP